MPTKGWLKAGHAPLFFDMWSLTREPAYIGFLFLSAPRTYTGFI